LAENVRIPSYTVVGRGLKLFKKTGGLNNRLYYALVQSYTG